MNTEFDNKKFFYADSEHAKYYDDAIVNIAPYYDIAQEYLISIIQYHLSDIKKEEIKILDIGAGTGNESIDILVSLLENKKQKINFTAIDKSSAMLNELKNKMPPQVSNSDNISLEYIEEDAFNLCEDEKKYDIIMSAFTIHHFTKSDKRKIYGCIHNLLNPSGFFVNLDLTTFNSKKQTQSALKYERIFIKRNHGRYELMKFLATSNARLKDTDRTTIFENSSLTFDDLFLNEDEYKSFLSMYKDDAGTEPIKSETNIFKDTEAWLQHYENDNLCDTVEWHQNMLDHLGFREVSMPYVFNTVSIIAAYK